MNDERGATPGPAARDVSAARLGEADLERRRRFFEITDEDVQRLASLRPLAEKVQHEIVEELTEFVLGSEEARRILRDDASLARARSVQYAYWLGLFTDRLDGAYVPDRLRLGLVQQRLAVSPEVVIGAFGRLLRAAHARLVRELSDPTAVRRAYVSLEKRTRFDESLMIDAYVASSLGDLREANEHVLVTGIRAHESADEADAARERAEAREQELRAVGETREMFIGILGHDLRSPLGAIATAAAVLQRGTTLGASEQKAVDVTVRSTRRMARMIAQLLDLTRIRLGGGLVLERKPVDLRSVCDSVAIEFPSVQLTVEGDATGVWDGDRLEECLANIVRNAVESATPGTPVVVTVRAGATEAVIQTTNQGDPIPADVLPKLFQPFRRGRSHQKSTGGNLGLGLYIANQIVGAHGGTLAARSAGGTTSFVIRLPRSPAAETAHAG